MPTLFSDSKTVAQIASDNIARYLQTSDESNPSLVNFLVERLSNLSTFQENLLQRSQYRGFCSSMNRCTRNARFGIPNCLKSQRIKSLLRRFDRDITGL